MSRFGQWTGTIDHLTNKLIDKEGLSFDKALAKLKPLIHEFAKEQGFVGSYTDKVLFVRSNYTKFYNQKINKPN